MTEAHDRDPGTIRHRLRFTLPTRLPSGKWVIRRMAIEEEYFTSERFDCGAGIAMEWRTYHWAFRGWA